VHGQLPVINEARQRRPAPEAVTKALAVAELAGSFCRCTTVTLAKTAVKLPGASMCVTGIASWTNAFLALHHRQA
ncbi:MAG: hypothetical protein ABWY08_01735, partial [Comamonas sp.]